jgi:hypothetical protein
MAFESQAQSLKDDGFAAFPGIRAGEALELLRSQCGIFGAVNK